MAIRWWFLLLGRYRSSCFGGVGIYFGRPSFSEGNTDRSYKKDLSVVSFFRSIELVEPDRVDSIKFSLYLVSEFIKFYIDPWLFHAFTDYWLSRFLNLIELRHFLFIRLLLNIFQILMADRTIKTDTSKALYITIFWLIV